MLYFFKKCVLYSVFFTIFSSSSWAVLDPEIFLTHEPDILSQPTVVFDIDEYLAFRMDEKDVEIISRRAPECLHISYTGPEGRSYPHIFFPFVGEVFLNIFSWGWNVYFFSSGVEHRNERVIPSFLKASFSQYFEDPASLIETLFTQKRIQIFSRKDLVSSNRCESKEMPDYSQWGDSKKDLRVIHPNIENLILGEDDCSYVVGDQYPFIQSSGSSSYTFKRFITSNKWVYDTEKFPAYCQGPYILGMLKACHEKVIMEGVKLRAALDVVSKIPIGTRKTSHWDDSPWAMRPGDHPDTEKWILSGQSLIEEFVGHRRKNPHNTPFLDRFFETFLTSSMDLWIRARIRRDLSLKPDAQVLRLWENLLTHKERLFPEEGSEWIVLALIRLDEKQVDPVLVGALSLFVPTMKAKERVNIIKSLVSVTDVPRFVHALIQNAPHLFPDGIDDWSRSYIVELLAPLELSRLQISIKEAHKISRKGGLVFTKAVVALAQKEARDIPLFAETVHKHRDEIVPQDISEEDKTYIISSLAELSDTQLSLFIENVDVLVREGSDCYRYSDIIKALTKMTPSQIEKLARSNPKKAFKDADSYAYTHILVSLAPLAERQIHAISSWAPILFPSTLHDCESKSQISVLGKYDVEGIDAIGAYFKEHCNIHPRCLYDTNMIKKGEIPGLVPIERGGETDESTEGHLSDSV